MTVESNKRKAELIREFWGKIDSISDKGRDLEKLSLPELTALNILTKVVLDYIEKKDS